MSSRTGTVSVSAEKEVPMPVAEMLLEMYRAAFAHLEFLAAARHLLHEEEFFEEMADPRIQKLIAWSAEDEPIGLMTLTNSLEAVPWISPGYYAKKFPEHHERGAIYYLGIAMVHPSRRGENAFRLMVERVVEMAVDDRAVLAWDVCAHNQSANLSRLFSTMLLQLSDATVTAVDQQVYYGSVVHGPRKED